MSNTDINSIKPYLMVHIEFTMRSIIYCMQRASLYNNKVQEKSNQFFFQNKLYFFSTIKVAILYSNKKIVLKGERKNEMKKDNANCLTREVSTDT